LNTKSVVSILSFDKVALLFLVVAGAGLVYRQLSTQFPIETGDSPGFRVMRPDSYVDYGSDLYIERVVFKPFTTIVHAPTIVEGSDSALHSFWYGGSREGGKDVAIYGATLDQGDLSWSDPRQVVTREQTQKDLNRYIKKLGNPVVTMDDSKRFWLFYVSVSVGGWAGSSINVKWSDDGIHWTPAKRLITSPFLNLSTLVKGNPVSYSDGHLIIPAYHEFIGKFAELIEVDMDGNVYNKRRLSWGREALQPSIMVMTSEQAQVYMRFAGAKPLRVMLTETADRGYSWTTPIKTQLPNPDAAIAVLGVRGGALEDALIMAFNNSPEWRNRLSLGLSKDNGKSWVVLHDFEYDQNTAERFSYPYMIQTNNGHYHLVYAWNRSHIKHVVFNNSWLEQRALAALGNN
jgi:predicted neuraminidase